MKHIDDLPVSHVRIAAMAAPGIWTFVRDYASWTSARVTASRIRLGHMPAYGIKFDAYNEGRSVYVMKVEA